MNSIILVSLVYFRVAVLRQLNAEVTSLSVFLENPSSYSRSQSITFHSNELVHVASV